MRRQELDERGGQETRREGISSLGFNFQHVCHFFFILAAAALTDAHRNETLFLQEQRRPCGLPTSRGILWGSRLTSVPLYTSGSRPPDDAQAPRAPSHTAGGFICDHMG